MLSRKSLVKYMSSPKRPRPYAFLGPSSNQDRTLTSDGLSGLLSLALKRPGHQSTCLFMPVYTFRGDENTNEDFFGNRSDDELTKCHKFEDNYQTQSMPWTSRLFVKKYCITAIQLTIELSRIRSINICKDTST